MWRRLAITLATGAALTGAYLGYSALMTPAIRAQLRIAELIPARQISDTPRPTESVRIAQAWMKHRPWTAEAKKFLWTKEMFIFSDEWTPRGDQGQIRFQPFAGVWITKNKAGEEEAFTVSAESALLKFESKFDFDNPQPGRVTGGSLEGEVQIDGPDGLKITGENFYFAEGTSSIFSPRGNPQPVQFQFGENKGTAGGMLIRLIKADRPLAKDRPNVIGVESIELSQNPKMELKLDDNPTSKPVIVKCTDTFKYHVESQTAVFDKNVLAYRWHEKTPSQNDRLRCDRLTVRFEPKPGVSTKTAQADSGKSAGGFQRIERDLQFRSLKAEGTAVLVASGSDLMAMMTLLTYHAASRTIQMSAPKAVVVKQRRNHLQCPNIRLVLGADNGLAEAVCDGNGWLETFDEITGEIAFAADWMKQLRKTTDAESGLDLVELQQDASFRQPARDTALGADLIRLWFTPLASSEPSQDLLNFGGAGSSPDPKRLLALKTVALVSPQMEADTDHLEVLFDEEPNAASPEEEALSRRWRAPLKLVSGKRTAKSQTTDKSVRAGSSLSAVRFPPPGILASIPPEDPKETAAPGRPPMMIAADKIRVRMLQPAGTEEPEVREIWTMGGVQVEQPGADDSGSMTVTGSKLHVENHSETDQIVHVYGEPGRPAHIRDAQQQLHIEGQLIHFDRAENLAWVEGAGLLQMPVKESLDGQELDEPQLLDVWWRDRMDFDGLLATFDGNVRVKLAEVRMQCQSMQVALAGKVRFTDSAAGSDPPKLGSITCRDGVEFENKRYLDNRLIEFQRAKGYEFHLDYSTQIAQAKGPGWMQMWQRRSSTRAGLAAMNSVEANVTSREPATEWEYSRVDFFGRMEGQIANRRTTLYDRVEVIHGPVLKPMDEFDQHHIPEGGGYMRCKKLEVVQTKSDEDSESFIQLLGAGNTWLEGHGFSGKADQISYDETKGKFILHSLGTRKATIYRTNAVGGRDQSDAQHLEFVPAENRVIVIHAVGGAGSP